MLECKCRTQNKQNKLIDCTLMTLLTAPTPSLAIHAFTIIAGQYRYDFRSDFRSRFRRIFRLSHRGI